MLHEGSYIHSILQWFERLVISIYFYMYVYILMKENVTWKKVYTQYSFNELSMWLFPYGSTRMFTNTYNNK